MLNQAGQYRFTMEQCYNFALDPDQNSSKTETNNLRLFVLFVKKKIANF